jgi:hypothetical protein
MNSARLIFSGMLAAVLVALVVVAAVVADVTVPQGRADDRAVVGGQHDADHSGQGCDQGDDDPGPDHSRWSSIPKRPGGESADFTNPAW